MPHDSAALIDAVSELLRRTGEMHHHDFLDTDGADPEWPLYYAERLQEPIGELLDAQLSKSELVYLLVRLAHEQPLEAPGAAWQRYYARVLVERYLG